MYPLLTEPPDHGSHKLAPQAALAHSDLTSRDFPPPTLTKLQETRKTKLTPHQLVAVKPR